MVNCLTVEYYFCPNEIFSLLPINNIDFEKSMFTIHRIYFSLLRSTLLRSDLKNFYKYFPTIIDFKKYLVTICGKLTPFRSSLVPHARAYSNLPSLLFGISLYALTIVCIRNI